MGPVLAQAEQPIHLVARGVIAGDGHAPLGGEVQLAVGEPQAVRAAQRTDLDPVQFLAARDIDDRQAVPPSRPGSGVIAGEREPAVVGDGQLVGVLTGRARGPPPGRSTGRRWPSRSRPCAGRAAPATAFPGPWQQAPRAPRIARAVWYTSSLDLPVAAVIPIVARRRRALPTTCERTRGRSATQCFSRGASAGLPPRLRHASVSRRPRSSGRVRVAKNRTIHAPTYPTSSYIRSCRNMKRDDPRSRWTSPSGPRRPGHRWMITFSGMMRGNGTRNGNCPRAIPSSPGTG